MKINDLNINSLIELLNEPSNQKVWLVNKDLIDVCKDCEYRHMCVDNRLPSQRKDGSWYHETECDYNPYIGKWNGEHNYLTLEECGVIITKDCYYRNDKKIETINL